MRQIMIICLIIDKDVINNLVMAKQLDSKTNTNIELGWSTFWNKGQYVEYNFISTNSQIYDFREWEYCQVEGWYEWAGSNENQCLSCQRSYYLLRNNISSL